MFRSRMRLVAIATVIALVAVPAAGQQHVGQVSGRVTDAAGAGLPGAVVKIAGSTTTTIAHTDAAGSFFIATLAPGAYSVAVATGGVTATLSRMNVTAGRRVHLSAYVRAPGVLPAGVGVAQSSTIITAEDLDTLPTGRDLTAILRLAPGVVPDRVNVGGSERGQGVTFVAGGADATQNGFVVNGVDLMDMSAVRTTPTYVDLGAVNEVSIVTGAYTAEFGRSSGGILNVVTKSGTNSFAGSGRLYAGFGSDLEQPGSQRAGNLFDNDFDAGAALGGPIVRDKVWFFGAGSAMHTNRQTHSAGLPVSSDFTGQSFSGRINGTLGTANQWHAYLSVNPYDRFGEGASETRPPETTWNQNGQTNFFKIEDTHVFNSNFYLTGMAAHVNQGFELRPQGGAATAFEDNGLFQGNYFELDTRRSSNELSIRGGYSATFGSQTHAFTVGLGRRSFLDASTAGWPGDTFSIFQTGEDPIAVFTPRNERAIRTTYLSAYAQDTLTVGKLTLNAGLRLDRQAYTNEGSAISFNPTFPLEVPSATFPQRDGEFSWTHVSPRISASYDVKGDGKFIVSTAYSSGSAPLWTDIAALTNPIEIDRPLLGSTAFRFLDANANRRFDAGEVRGTSIIVGGVPTDDPAFFNQRHQVQADLEAPITRQFTGGVDYLLTTDVSVGVRYTHQSTSRMLDYVNLVDDGGVIRPVTSSDFLPGSPIVGSDLDGDPFSLPAFYLDPALSFTGDLSVSNGDRRSGYHGLSLFFNKRLSNRWMFRGHVTLSDWDQEVPATFFQDANDLVGSGDNDGAPFADTSADPRKTGVYLNSRWAFSAEGLYDVGHGWMTSARLYARQGLPYATFVSDHGPDGLARNFQFEPLGERRLDHPVVADIRVQKALTFGRYPVDVSLDLFNAFGSRAVLGREGDLASPRKGLTTEFLSPRTFRIGARIRF